MPHALWEFLRTVESAPVDLAKLSDRGLFKEAQERVNHSIAEWEKVPRKERKRQWAASSFPDAGKPRAARVRGLLNFLLDERDTQRTLLRRVEAYRREVSSEGVKKRFEASRRKQRKFHSRQRKRSAFDLRKEATRERRREKLIASPSTLPSPDRPAILAGRENGQSGL